MTTTLVRNSIVGDEWIRAAVAACPPQRRIDPATNNWNGDILTGPVRLSFFGDSLFELPKPKPGQQSEPKFETHALFTPLTDFAIFYEEYYKMCAKEFPEYWNGSQYAGLQSPFRDQAEKLKYAGFTPGCTFMKLSSRYAPNVVDNRMNPIVDRKKVYPGIWAVCAVNVYAGGKSNAMHKKGVSFGLQSVMIIGDDEKFGGAGPDAKAQFAGVNITAPIARPDMSKFPPGGQPPPPGPGIPGYTTHMGAPGNVQPGGPPPTTYAPPAGMPPAPPASHSAPPATTYPSEPNEADMYS